nr:lysosomal acid phosphatase-like [Leptinotarsa decemlineata]
MVIGCLIVICVTSPIFGSATLISVIQVFRHGQRTPTEHYPNDPYSDPLNWPVAPGQLTNVGKEQLYNLGKFTRERYKEALPVAYSPDFIHAETTEFDRTHMSAQCYLQGLFPPTIKELWNPRIFWSPIPVHPTKVVTTFQPCAQRSKEHDRVLNEEPYFKNIDATYASTYEYLSEHAGLNQTTLSDSFFIYDTLFIENEFGFVAPPWTERIFPEPLKTLVEYYLEVDGFNEKLQRLSAGPFLNEVIEHFEKMEQDPTSAKFFRVYSAHDITIVEILSALGAFQPHFPYFASTIYFELRKTSEESYVNIYYKQKDTIQEITPSGCSKFNCPIFL